MYRGVCTCADAVACIGDGQRGHDGTAQVLLCRADHRADRLPDVMHTRGLSLPLSVPRWHDERIPGADGELVHTSDDPPHGVVRQRPHGVDAVLLLDLRFSGEDGRARQAPVDDLRRRYPRFALAALDLLAVSRCMGPLWPSDGPAITPGDQHEALASGRRAVVCRHQLPVFHLVAQRLQL